MGKNIIFCLCDFETTGVDANIDYPIEIGCMFLDKNFNILTTYESLIKWITLNDLTEWPTRCKEAYNIHNIDIKCLHYKDTRDPCFFVNVASKINSICKEFKCKPIILSDCGNFEFNFMKKLFNLTNNYYNFYFSDSENFVNVEFPFHYCAWDTNLLLKVTGVGDPKNRPHRAMKDVGLIYKALILALNKIDFFG